MKKIIQLLIVILLLGSLNALKAQCSANFTYTVLAGNNVNFVSTSTFTNAGTNYTWAFGDGIIGTGAVASHQYSTSGVYSTTLSIINSGPTCTSSVVQTVSVTTSSCSVTPNFSYTVNPGGVVNFVNTSTGTSSLFTTYWDFGDGTTSNAPSFVTHTYTSNGLFNVNLYIMDSLTFACYTNTIIPVSISGLPCSVSSSFSYSFGYSNGTVFFYNSTTPISNAIVTNWNFGDGNTSTTASPIHTYSTSGTYSVSLISSEGTTSCTSIFVNTLTIIPCTLTANFTYTLGNNGLVTFSNTSSPTTSNTVANWYFGDGNSNWGNVVTNNYSSNGLFYVHLTISDSITGMSWCNDTITIPISISNVTCSLGGTTAYAYSYGYNGLGYFSSNITSTNTTSSIWYYGDGTQSPILSTYNYSGNHTYSINGIYTATFVVWENSSPSCSLSISTVSFVINGATCSLVANFNYTLGSSGMVTFNDASTGTSSLTNYYWDFGDGNYAYGSALTSTVNNYLTNGLYNVTLNVIDSLNPCWDYTVIPVNINNSPNLGCTPTRYLICIKIIRLHLAGMVILIINPMRYLPHGIGAMELQPLAFTLLIRILRQDITTFA